jgi:GNAT superfamily N-acetyltransferase
MDPDKLIRNYWKTYLGTSFNTYYHGEEYQAVLSDDLERPPYNLVVPLKQHADLSGLKGLAAPSESRPVLHGEKEFIEKYRGENFPETEKVREDHWMKFKGPKPEKKDFEGLDFRWIDRSGTEDYLQVLQEVFGSSDHYIDLHRDPVRTYGEEVYRLAVYGGERTVAIGELRPENSTGFIFSLSTVEEQQGGGLGTEVLRRLVEKAERVGFEDIYLLAEDTDWLVDFYRDRGFEVDFTVVCYSGGSWDEVFE